MRNPLFEVRAFILDNQKLSGIVATVLSNGAEVKTSKGKTFLPYDVDVVRGDLVTIVGGRIVSKQSMGEGEVFYV